MMGDYHVRFRERFRGETPLYLLDQFNMFHTLTIRGLSLEKNIMENMKNQLLLLPMGMNGFMLKLLFNILK